MRSARHDTFEHPSTPANGEEVSPCLSKNNPSALVMYPPIGICNYGKARIFVLAARPFYSNVVAAVIVAIGAFVAPH